MESVLEVDLAGIRLRNPIIAAAGTGGYVRELSQVLNLARLGAVTTKSITREPREGNPPWRVIDARAGMLNAVGLANVGLERFLADKLPGSAPTVIIGSVAGGSIDDYVKVASAFDEAEGLSAIELNVSCPNTGDGRMFTDDPAALGELIRAVVSAAPRRPVFVKLPPDGSDVVGLAGAAVEAGARGLTLVNTFRAMAIDVETRQPRLSNGVGGLSGPAIHPIAVRIVREVSEQVARPAGVPVIGIGGVQHWQDAAELILAGATAIGVGTALFADPGCVKRVTRGLEAWAGRQGAPLRDLVGRVEH